MRRKLITRERRGGRERERQRERERVASSPGFLLFKLTQEKRGSLRTRLRECKRASPTVATCGIAHIPTCGHVNIEVARLL